MVQLCTVKCYVSVFKNLTRQSMSWNSLPPMPTERSRCQAGLVKYANGTKGILVTGGESSSTSEYLDLDTLVWESKASLPFDIESGQFFTAVMSLIYRLSIK